MAQQKPCPEGTIRNPETKRCVKSNGTVAKKLARSPVNVILQSQLAFLTCSPKSRLYIVDKATSNELVIRCTNSKEFQGTLFKQGESKHKKTTVYSDAAALQKYIADNFKVSKIALTNDTLNKTKPTLVIYEQS
jgi:hypothetical protein